MTPLFESDELRGRAARARELMAEQGLDALLVSGDFSAGANYYYFSGHLPRDYQQNFSRPHLMVLPLDGEPFLYVYGVNVDNARDMSYVVDVVAYAPPFDGVALAGVLRDRGLEAATIGAELGTDQRLWMPVGEFRALEAGLPYPRFVGAAGILWRGWAVKRDGGKA